MKKLLSVGLMCMAAAGYLTLDTGCTPKADNSMAQLVDQDLDFAAGQYTYFMTNIPSDAIPRTLDSAGRLLTCSERNWTIGFYPGTLWYLYEYTGDSSFKQAAEEKLKLIEPLKNYKGTHDLGFMMYCSFGNGYRLTQNPHYKDVLLTSAASLSTRFNDTVGSIKSWNWKEGQFPVIIDNMMNLELLCWASKTGGDPKYMQEAVIHANTTLKNHFRPDYSSYHVVLYDPHTGAVVKKQTHQGYADSSAWSRGQSWGLYGYSMMFEETGDSAYLTQARHIAGYLLNNPHMPEDLVPYWDYDAPNIPDAKRDVSAAAIMASALIQLSTSTPDTNEATQYKKAAEKILVSLSQPEYRYQQGEGQGFLLKHSISSFPSNSDVDRPLNYADYYFVEALMRYKKLFLHP